MTPAEAMQSHLAELSEDLARCVQAQEEQARAAETTANEMGEIRRVVGELSDEVGRMIALFQGYVKDTSDLRSEVRKMLKASNG